MRLDSFALFEGLTAPIRAEAEARLRIVEAGARQQLIRRGDPVGGIYLVERGALRVYFVGANGREGTLHWVEEGEVCVLSVNSTLAGVGYPGFVEGGENGARFAMLPAEVFLRLFAEQRPVREFVLKALSDRMFELMRQLEGTASQTLEQRLATTLLKHADAAGRVGLTHAVIAGYLGTTREVVSRLLRAMARDGLLDTRFRLIQLLDGDRLTALATPIGD